DDLHRADLRGTRQCAGGERGPERVEAIEPVRQLAADIRYQMHDVGGAFDDQALGDRHRPDLRHPPDIIATEIDEHDAPGDRLRVRTQLALELQVLPFFGSPRPRACDRPHRQLSTLETYHHFR